MLTMNCGKKFLFLHLIHSDAGLVNSADVLSCYRFVCVSLVRTSCLPFMLTLNTLVSLWAPGTHGTESRIRQVSIKLHVLMLY